MVSIFYSSMLASSCANHVTSVMWLWVGVPLLGMSSGCGGICPSPLMSCMYCTFDVLYIYLRLLFGIACLAYHTAIKFALYQLLYPEFIVNSFDIKRAAATFVQFVAHSMANINDNFWQAISVFMFQGECTVNLNNLFSKPSTPNLTWTNPRQSFLGNYDYASHFTYDNSSVSVRFHFLDLHLPSSASVWSVLFGFSTM